VDTSPIAEEAFVGGSAAAEIGALARPHVGSAIEKLAGLITAGEDKVSDSVRLAAIRELLNRAAAAPAAAHEKPVMHLYQWVTKKEDAIPDPARQKM
jgi:hypothetical protein